MQEVGGSIPPGSTSLRWLRQLRLGEPSRSEGCRVVARRAKTGLGKPSLVAKAASPFVAKAAASEGQRRASASPIAGKAPRCSLFGEVGQRHEIRLHPRKPRFRTFLCRYYRQPACATSETQCGRGASYLEIQKNLCCVQRRKAGHRLREILAGRAFAKKRL